MPLPIRTRQPPTDEATRPDDPPDMPVLSPAKKQIAARMKRVEALKMRSVRKQLARPSHSALLKQHIADYKDCKACPLGQHVFCSNHVFCRGYIPAEVLFIGEAPGISEDTLGIPFIGPAGQLLDEIIEESSERALNGPNRFTYCITNAVLCIPPEHQKTPKPADILACNHRLNAFIRMVEPEVVIAVGQVAERAIKLVLNDPHYGFPFEWVAIRHPSYMLRQNDVETERKRAILAVTDALEKYVIPF